MHSREPLELNSPMMVSGLSRFGGSFMGVVDAVTISPACRPPIPTKSMSPPPAVKASTPPSKIEPPLALIWIAAVPTLSLEGSWSVTSAAAGEATAISINVK
jgi:hypothetical protein